MPIVAGADGLHICVFRPFLDVLETGSKPRTGNLSGAFNVQNE
jgi:hypothetical protein